MFFRSFSLATWILILTVVSAFVLVHYVYQLSQYKVHATLYSQAEVDLYESTSALLTVYSYFMCGIPPRVLLGRLFTGKILFIISSFSAILIATILQGGMTKLLLSKVHYPEIDTLEDLEKSNIFIQVLDIATSSTFFSAHEGLKSKLSNTLNYCQISLGAQADYSNTFYDIYSSRTGVRRDITTGLNPEHEDNFNKLLENAMVIAETDALLVSVPQTAVNWNSERNLRNLNWLSLQETDYHLISECLESRPFFFAFMKNSFLFDEVNRLLTRFSETGHKDQLLMGLITELEGFIPYVTRRRKDIPAEEARALNFDDMQPAFVSLALGLFFSFLAFVAELLADLLRNSIVLKYLRIFRGYISRRA